MTSMTNGTTEGERVRPETTKSFDYVGVLMWAHGEAASGGTIAVHICHRCASLTTDIELHNAVPCGPPSIPITPIGVHE